MLCFSGKNSKSPVILLMLIWSTCLASTQPQDCSIIQASDLESTPSSPGLIAHTLSTGVNDSDVQLTDFQIVCLSQGEELNTWTSISLVANYTYNGTSFTSQFQFECVDSNWTASVNRSTVYTRTDPPDADFETAVRMDCTLCVDPRQDPNVDNPQHCLACANSCSEGLRRCTSQNECCSYFFNNQCVSSCPNNSLPNGDFICCPEGYQGTNCTEDIDECSALSNTSICLNGGVCNNTIGGFMCICSNGYTGTFCGMNINECEDQNVCMNEGICEDTPGSYTCHCRLDYTGENCETIIDDCASQPCLNGGSCSDGVNSFTCNCTEGWDGSVCNECTLEGCMECRRGEGQRAECDTCRNGYNIMATSGICVAQTSGLSGGATAGIIVAVIIGLILVALLVALIAGIMYIQRNKKLSSAFRESHVLADKQSSAHVMMNPMFRSDALERVEDSGISIEGDDNLVVNRGALEFEEENDDEP